MALPGISMTVDRSVDLGLSDVRLKGDLTVPREARGLVLFAHGSGSSRNSPRNRSVARLLHEHGLGTLLFDLLAEEEDRVQEMRFNIDLLSLRLVQATRWVLAEPSIGDLPVGYFGASTGAAAALRAAAVLVTHVKAVVSRGGRPDLAMDALAKVKAPTLLIVGALDTPVIEMNRRALEDLRCVKEMRIVPGATHLFEEPGKLNEVAGMAAEWYEEHLP